MLTCNFFLSYHRCTRGYLYMRSGKRWRRVRVRGKVQVLYNRRWRYVTTMRRRGRRMLVIRYGRKVMKISIHHGRVKMFIPAHFETVTPKPKPKPRPIRRKRPRSRGKGRYGRLRGRRRRRRWRKRLQRRRRRRRRRYIRRRRKPLFLFYYKRRWRSIIRWRGQYRLRYGKRWITF